MIRVDKVPFLSTLSLRRATTALCRFNMHTWISIHALLAESDMHTWESLFHSRNFYPRSPCGERLPINVMSVYGVQISIHALLAESDKLANVRNSPTNKFLSTLSLRRATPFIHCLPRHAPFLSTLSLRRATPCHGRVHQSRDYFYPRSPCGERRNSLKIIGRQFDISIHALLAESDPWGCTHVILII